MRILGRSIVISLLVLPLTVMALSRRIGRDIEFPKAYDRLKAQALRAVIQDEQFKFVDGTVSYWPPDWATRLSFEGNSESLNTFFRKLREIDEMGLGVILFKGRDDEKRRDSDWQLDFSHTRPNQVTVYLNLNSKHLELNQLELPEWSPKPAE